MDNNKSTNNFIIAIAIVVLLFIVMIGKSVKIVTSQNSPKNLDISKSIDVMEGEYVKTNATLSTPEYCTYIHTLMRGLPIPIGKEHYYLITSKDLSQCISVRADEEWAKKFNNGITIDQNGVPTEGYVEELEDKVLSNLNTVKRNYEEKQLNINVNSSLCIDMLAVKYAKRLIISSVVTLLIIIWFIIDYMKNRLLYADRSPAGKAMVSVISCVFLISFLIMIISWQMI